MRWRIEFGILKKNLLTCEVLLVFMKMSWIVLGGKPEEILSWVSSLLKRQTVGGDVLKLSEKIIANKVLISANKDFNLQCLPWQVIFLCCWLFLITEEVFVSFWTHQCFSHFYNVLAGKWKRGRPGPQGDTRRAASSQWNHCAEDPAQLPWSHTTETGDRYTT